MLKNEHMLDNNLLRIFEESPCTSKLVQYHEGDQHLKRYNGMLVPVRTSVDLRRHNE